MTSSSRKRVALPTRRKHTDAAERPAERTSRRLGRPRADGRPPITREQILDAATERFAKVGVAATSVRDLAGGLGIHAASIFHQFPTKEDIVSAVAGKIFAGELAHFEAIRDLGLPADVTLYKIVRDDALFCASGEGDQRRLFLLPELRSGRFPQLERLWDQLVGHYDDVIRSGIADGVFRDVPRRATAEALNSLAMTGALSWNAATLGSPRDLGREIARLALRSVLVMPQRLDAIERRALAVHVR